MTIRKKGKELFIFNLSALHFHEKALTSSTISEGSITTLLKMWLFRAFQIDQITVY
jgi:hypothetical protein